MVKRVADVNLADNLVPVLEPTPTRSHSRPTFVLLVEQHKRRGAEPMQVRQPSKRSAVDQGVLSRDGAVANPQMGEWLGSRVPQRIVRSER